MRNGKPSSSTGNVAAAVIAVLASALAAVWYSFSSSTKSRNQIESESRRQTMENATIGEVSSVSRFRSLMSPRKNPSGNYVPGLFAENYYNGVWNLMANPKLKMSGVKLQPKGLVAINSVGDEKIAVKRAGSVMESSLSAKALLESSTGIKILQTNFRPDLRVAESVDIEVQNSSRENQSKRNFRVNLLTPLPFDPIVEISRAGENKFTRDNIELASPQEYDIRVLASGVAYDAEIYINGALVKTVGGFDKNGNISHNAVRPNALNEEIGRIRYDFSKGLDGTTGSAHCAPTVDAALPVFTVSAIIRGPDAETWISTRGLIVRDASTEKHDTLELATLQKACNKQCRYLGSKTHNDRDRASELVLASRNYGDFSYYDMLTNNSAYYGITDKKLCMNMEDAHKLFVDKFKREPSNPFEMSIPYGHLYEIVAYDPKTCEREFLFERGACGCFAEDTRVLLGDGVSEKRIADLQATDLVWNPIHKRGFPIRRMTRGPEKLPLLKIETGAESLLVTGEHPFPLADGTFVPAHTLVKGQSIRMNNGLSREIQAIEPSNQGRPVVWNLEIDAPDDDWTYHQVVANGVITGDLVIQRGLSKQGAGVFSLR